MRGPDSSHQLPQLRGARKQRRGPGQSLVKRSVYHCHPQAESHVLTVGEIDGRSSTDDYSAFNDVWDKPDGGMHRYLYRFLSSPDTTFQHIAVWTIVQLLESGGEFQQLLISMRST